MAIVIDRRQPSSSPGTGASRARVRACSVRMGIGMRLRCRRHSHAPHRRRYPDAGKRKTENGTDRDAQGQKMPCVDLNQSEAPSNSKAIEGPSLRPPAHPCADCPASGRSDDRGPAGQQGRGRPTYEAAIILSCQRQIKHETACLPCGTTHAGSDPCLVVHVAPWSHGRCAPTHIANAIRATPTLLENRVRDQ